MNADNRTAPHDLMELLVTEQRENDADAIVERAANLHDDHLADLPAFLAPDIETLMGTRPCADYPRERVEQVLASCGHPRTWEALAIAARDRGWECAGDTGVSLYDLRLTAYRAATPEQRLRGVVHSTRARVEGQMRRWPEVSPAVDDVRRRLLAWKGDAAEIHEIRDAAYDAATAADAAAGAAYNAAADASYADYAVSYAAASYADAAARAAAADASYTVALDAAAAAYDAALDAAAWRGTVFICRLLDGVGDVGGQEVSR